MHLPLRSGMPIARWLLVLAVFLSCSSIVSSSAKSNVSRGRSLAEAKSSENGGEEVEETKKKGGAEDSGKEGKTAKVKGEEGKAVKAKGKEGKAVEAKGKEGKAVEAKGKEGKAEKGINEDLQRERGCLAMPELCEDKEKKKGKDDGEGEGEEEEEEEFSDADFEVAVMMLGIVSVVMTLIHLVTWKDEDIRRYSWKIISTTISIFLAVLLFQGNNDLLTLLLGHNLSEGQLSFAQYVHSTIYIVMLQVTMAYISGVAGPKPEHKLTHEEWRINDALSIHDGKKVDELRALMQEDKKANTTMMPTLFKQSNQNKGYVKIEEREVLCEKVQVKEEVELRMQCWARLLAHMAGFAAIHAGARQQQQRIFRSSPLLEFIPVILNQIIIMIIFKFFGWLRKRQQEQMANDNSGATEKHRGHLMEEAAFEGENDISSLSVSFLTVQVIRYWLTNVLPDEEGMEVGGHIHSDSDIISLYCIGLGFAILAAGLVVLQGKLQASSHEHEAANGHGHSEHEEHEEEEINCAQRMLMIALNATAMSFAWCTLWATRWLCSKYGLFPIEAIIGRVCLAFALSMLSMILLFGLDFVDDSQKASAANASVRGKSQTGQAIQTLVTALGILIGFSWEHCFDGSVGAMTSLLEAEWMRGAAKFVMGVLIALLIVPMWRQHFLMREIMYQRMKDQIDKKEEMQESSHNTAHSLGGQNAPLIPSK